MMKIVNGHIELENEISALTIAEKLGAITGHVIKPTDEQTAIIESKHWGPAVIIAGAGSGKTETMSQRVLWLVANGVVQPHEILGLTFTRKAAGELATRIRKRIRQLQRAGLLNHLKSNESTSVEVSTYHSYAGRVLKEYGILLGIDSTVEPIGEAAHWQLTQQIISRAESEDFAISKSLKTIVENAISLSAQLSEHNVDPAEVEALDRALIGELQSLGGKPNQDVAKLIALLQERIAILPMVAATDKYRKENGLLTFDDHMSLAARLSDGVKDIAIRESARYRVVLLDEYQDTSFSQVRFLSNLFGNTGHSVTAVGDPHQSIYGWRGAAAQTLSDFGNRFASQGTKSEEFNLLTTWRNDVEVLDFANHIIDQHAATIGGSAATSVKRLEPRDNAGAGEVFAGRYLSREEEAEAIADFMEKHWIAGEKSAAVLVRAKSYIPSIENALRNRHLPTEVVGLGGLIHVPEIADIIALLQAITMPDKGTALARLLTGPRIALGPRDLAGLGRFARDIAKTAGTNVSKSVESALVNGELDQLEADEFPIGSIIEALDQIADAPKNYFSNEGLKRLREFADELTELRRTLHGSLTDIITEAERFLNFDTELLVRDGWRDGRRHLDAFLDEAATFQRTGGTLSTFLRWLEVADAREGGLKPATVSVSNAAIQILTIHASKGAEWDIVAIPGLNQKNFPNSGQKSDSWLKSSGSIPLQLRKDTMDIADFGLPSERTYSETNKALKAFDDRWKAKKREEELRLAYVAFTRAKSHLFGTSAVFGDGKEPVAPSEIYIWLKDFVSARYADRVLADVETVVGKNPSHADAKHQAWPVAPARQSTIISSAEHVKTFAAKKYEELSPASDEERALLKDAASLIEERRQWSDHLDVYLPSRLSVSTLIRLKADADELALNIRRPMPNHTAKVARQGTEFHTWIERHFETSVLFDDDIFETSEIELDEGYESQALKKLKEDWLASVWADRQPISVEEGFEIVIEGILFRGRIDAVYRINEDKYEVVDWKTGRVKSGDDLAEAAIQLAMYRLAYSKLHNIPLENISAAFHYIPANETIRPADLMDEAQIQAIIAAIPSA